MCEICLIMINVKGYWMWIMFRGEKWKKGVECEKCMQE